MKDIDNNVVVLAGVSFFTDLASAMINPVLPIFVVIILENGVDKLGVIVAVSTFISYFLRLFSGYLSDRYGLVKPLVVGGYAISAISKPLLYFSQTWQNVAFLKGAERLGKAARSAPKDVLISFYSQENQAGKTFGFHKTLDIAGELSGALILFILLSFLGESEPVIRGIFLFTAIPGLIAVILVAFFVKDVAPQKKEKKAFRLSPGDKRLLVPLSFYFMFTFFVFNEALFVLRSQELGFRLATIPLLVIAYDLTQTLLSYRIGLLFDRGDAGKLLMGAYGAGILTIILFMAPVKLMTWLGFVSFGIYTVTIVNTFRAYISQNATNKGSVYGLFYAGNALSAAFGVMVASYIWEYKNSLWALSISLLGALLVALANLAYARIRALKVQV